jgi:recombination protein U
MISTYANRGQALEELIKIQNNQYTHKGALIHKVPTEWIPIRDYTGKIASAKVENKAAVDFLGVYKGVPIAFDAKHTKDKRISWKRLEPHQWEFLKKWHECGGIAFVLVSWNMKKFYTIPILEWGLTGKSVLLSNLQPVPMKGGLPDYLKAISLQYTRREKKA